MNHYALHDIKVAGCCYTWNNKQQGNDRVFSTLERVWEIKMGWYVPYMRGYVHVRGDRWSFPCHDNCSHSVARYCKRQRGLIHQAVIEADQVLTEDHIRYLMGMGMVPIFSKILRVYLVKIVLMLFLTFFQSKKLKGNKPYYFSLYPKG